MLPIITVIITAILAVIFWYKKINPETIWIYAIYCLAIVVIFLLVVLTVA